MKVGKIQLIPGLVALETNISEIFGFSFYNNKKFKDFFKFDEGSEIKIQCYLSRDVLNPPPQVDCQFSNIGYKDGEWFYFNKNGPFTFKFNINEKRDVFLVNANYQRIFIKAGWLQPFGYILTDYLVNKLEQGGKTYHEGAAARYKDNTYLFFGFGRNFKTTIINQLIGDGADYIAEEFFLLDGERVYATIPNSYRFDLRQSHKDFLKNNLFNKKLDSSVYNKVVFLIYSRRDRVTELDFIEANKMAELCHHAVNSYYYDFFRAKDFFEGKSDRRLMTFFQESKVKFFKIEFTDYKKVIDFINTL